jgi:hypothetical protein
MMMDDCQEIEKHVLGTPVVIFFQHIGMDLKTYARTVFQSRSPQGLDGMILDLPIWQRLDVMYDLMIL